MSRFMRIGTQAILAINHIKTVVIDKQLGNNFRVRIFLNGSHTMGYVCENSGYFISSSSAVKDYGKDEKGAIEEFDRIVSHLSIDASNKYLPPYPPSINMDS